jgi:drug/metabolite transporter (DMT)-like permease
VFFPILEAIHVMGLALSIGTIVLVDLRTLRWGEPPPANLGRWTWSGFALMLLTGAVLFLSNVSRYTHNSGFLVKMASLAIALLAHFTVHRKPTRFAAILSLILWSSVVISAKFVADLDA